MPKLNKFLTQVSWYQHVGRRLLSPFRCWPWPWQQCSVDIGT